MKTNEMATQFKNGSTVLTTSLYSPSPSPKVENAVEAPIHNPVPSAESSNQSMMSFKTAATSVSSIFSHDSATNTVETTPTPSYRGSSDSKPPSTSSLIRVSEDAHPDAGLGANVDEALERQVQGTRDKNGSELLSSLSKEQKSSSAGGTTSSNPGVITREDKAYQAVQTSPTNSNVPHVPQSEVKHVQSQEDERIKASPSIPAPGNKKEASSSISSQIKGKTPPVGSPGKNRNPASSLEQKKFGSPSFQKKPSFIKRLGHFFQVTSSNPDDGGIRTTPPTKSPASALYSPSTRRQPRRLSPQPAGMQQWQTYTPQERRPSRRSRRGMQTDASGNQIYIPRYASRAHAQSNRAGLQYVRRGAIDSRPRKKTKPRRGVERVYRPGSPEPQSSSIARSRVNGGSDAAVSEAGPPLAKGRALVKEDSEPEENSSIPFESKGRQDSVIADEGTLVNKTTDQPGEGNSKPSLLQSTTQRGCITAGAEKQCNPTASSQEQYQPPQTSETNRSKNTSASKSRQRSHPKPPPSP
ncbi:uncharacterized protein BDR25DRAFT_63057 [Lindgomyces ingoldianus]|uniref:Uncharacterized protein n=1 Tax=Lindgomyces ingoldianus TaxID=673940 RepID=A0ACB6QKI9_9PLEO|nr:uncharacterized protein BDR25DRAFT_63057 [Lindgomyces ingoldianus]KAF2467503.1 hypothetical protein BDR25DRAFT_63057 [Lindgomyces ingoldianus]